jgi:hypothetical protein
MKLQVSNEDAKLLQYYGIHNFDQLRQVYLRTRDERLLPLFTHSVGYMYQFTPD